MNEPAGTFEAQGAADTKRGNGRDSLLLKAILRFPTSNEEGEVRIRNLSAGGLMAEAPVRVSRGEKVEINLRNIGWIGGSVVWVTEGRLGIAFDVPINPLDARKPVSSGDHDVPRYLQKLNEQSAIPKNLRRI
jgi:PilZ domain